MGAQWKAKGKALVADAKGKLFGKLVKEITVAARLGGGDPASNSRLRMAVEAWPRASSSIPPNNTPSVWPQLWPFC